MGPRAAVLLASLVWPLYLAPACALADTCVDYDEPYELVGEFERGTGVTAIALDASTSLLHVTYEFTCCEGIGTGTRTVVIDVSDPEQTVSLDTYGRPGSDPPEALAHVTADGGVVCGFITDGPEDELYVGDVTDPSDISFVTIPITGFNGTSAAALRGGYLYVTNGTTLVVFDVSDPSSPGELGRVTTGLPAAEMVAGDGIVYVAGGATFWTADVMDPANPGVDGMIDLSHSVEHVAREGDRAVVLGDDILTVIDVTDPSAPVAHGSLGIYGNDIAVQGEHVLVAQFGLIVLVDVTDPDAPGERGAVAGPLEPVYGFSPGYMGLVTDELRVHAGHTYSFPTGHGQGGVHIFVQLSLPDDAVVTTLATPTIRDLVVEGAQGTAMAQSLDGELYVFDLSTPISPTQIGYLATGLNHSSHARRGSLASLASRDDGIAVVDLSDPTTPVVVGTEDSEAAEAVAMSPGIVYATGEYDLRVVDLGVPSAPVIIGRTEDLWDTSPYGGQTVVSAGDLVLVGTYDHLRVIDVAAPAAPQLIGSVELERGVSGLVIDGHHAFVSSGTDLLTIDFSDPSNPAIVATLLEAGGRSMTIIGTALYAGGGTGYGFQVIDIADPLALSPIGRYTSTTWGLSLGLADRAGVLLSAGWEGLTVLWPQCGTVGVGEPKNPSVPGPLSMGALSIHPSPARAAALIRLVGHATDATPLVARVIDVRGRVVDEVVLHRQTLGHAGRWETDRHAGGVYFVTVETPRGVHSRRIVLLD